MRYDSTLVESPHELPYAQLERWTSLAAGIALAAAGLQRRRLSGTALTLAAAPLLYRGVVGTWPSFMRVRDDTRRALGGPAGIRVDESIRVNLPPREVFALWRQLENLPMFMSHLSEVVRLSATRSRWVAKAPAGTTVEWTAEVINEVDNELIGWRSLPGSDVAVAGSVQFRPVDDEAATLVRIELQYAPPAGTAGALVARLFGQDPARTIREDLARMKTLLESGTLVPYGASRVRGGHR